MEKFFEAIRKNDIETVESMIQSGQDVNVKDVFGSSPLHVAIEHERLDIAEMLIDAGAERIINLKTK